MRKKKKQKVTNSDKKCLPKYKIFKNTSNNLNVTEEVSDKIENLCIETSKIVRYTYYFLKLYFTDLFEHKKEFPIIDDQLIRYIYSFVSTIKSKTKCKTYVDDINTFNDDVFSKLGVSLPSRDGLTQILTYETTTIITCIENNIKNNLFAHFNKYINILLMYKTRVDNIKKLNCNDATRKEKFKQLNSLMSIVKKDILSTKPIVCKGDYKKFVAKHRKILFGHIEYINEDYVLYDVCVKPQDYLRTFFVICKKFDDLNGILDDEHQIKLFNVLPLRTSLIPKYFTIDTEIIIQNFKDILKRNMKHITKKYTTVEELRRHFKEDNIQKNIWKVLFNTKFFKDRKNYRFDFVIKTDNVGYSAQFKIKKEKQEMFYVPKNKLNNGIKHSAKYIEEIICENRFELKNRRIVCIDPNKGNLMYCGTYKNGKFETFRYTQNQRRVETKKKKYMNIRNEIKQKNKVGIKTIEQLETEKSKYNKNKITNKDVKEYIQEMEKINTNIDDHYDKKIYRKLNMNAYTNTQKSESKMIKNFEKKMGTKEEIVVVVGDYSCKSTNIKGVEPAIAIKIIEILKRHGYETYIIDEYNTSKKCNGCEENLEKFKKIKSKKPKTKGKEIIVNGLLRCQSVKLGCETIHNRDKNAVKNMLKIVKSLLAHKDRPASYRR